MYLKMLTEMIKTHLELAQLFKISRYICLTRKLGGIFKTFSTDLPIMGSINQ